MRATEVTGLEARPARILTDAYIGDRITNGVFGLSNDGLVRRRVTMTGLLGQVGIRINIRNSATMITIPVQHISDVELEPRYFDEDNGESVIEAVFDELRVGALKEGMAFVPVLAIKECELQDNAGL